MKNLVLLVEGQGDVAAVPTLVKKLFTERGAWRHLGLDPSPIQAGEVRKLTGAAKSRELWLKRLKLAGQRPSTGAVLLILDGDADAVEGKPFCAVEAARCLAERGAGVGAGRLFSLACVFARQEFESWLIAGVESLAGKRLPDGRAGVVQNHPPKPANSDVSPRDAKGWLDGAMAAGYKPTTDQEPLTRIVELNAIRAAGTRSFRRLESAVDELIAAVRDDRPIISPRR